MTTITLVKVLAIFPGALIARCELPRVRIRVGVNRTVPALRAISALLLTLTTTGIDELRSASRLASAPLVIATTSTAASNRQAGLLQTSECCWTCALSERIIPTLALASIHP